MSEIKITVTAPEITEAINNLANAIRSGAMPGKATVAGDDGKNDAAELRNARIVVPYKDKQDVGEISEAARGIPTAAPQYTLEMIAKAGTVLIDAGKMNELTALLARYGVEALTALDPAHYGTFANELRSLGASI